MEAQMKWVNQQLGSKARGQRRQRGGASAYWTHDFLGAKSPMYLGSTPIAVNTQQLGGWQEIPQAAQEYANETPMPWQQSANTVPLASRQINQLPRQINHQQPAKYQQAKHQQAKHQPVKLQQPAKAQTSVYNSLTNLFK